MQAGKDEELAFGSFSLPTYIVIWIKTLQSAGVIT